MTITDTTEAVPPLPVGYLEPAEQTGSDDETQPVRTVFNVGDLVQIQHVLWLGQFGTVRYVTDRPYGVTVQLVFGDVLSAFAPTELKLIRRAEKPGWIPLDEQLYRPRVYKDRFDGKWVCEDDLRLSMRFRHPEDARPVAYRDHDSYAAALATVREQAALDQARRDAVDIKARLYRGVA